MGKIDSEKILSNIYENMFAELCSSDQELIKEAIDASHQRGRDEMREEAAHKACDCVHHVSCKPLSMDKKGQYIAKQIRSLK